MMKIRNLLLAILTVSSTLAFAQEQRIKEEGKTLFNPHWFMQVQVGAAHTIGEAKFTDLISPAAALNVGYKFAPAFGARIGVSGWQAKAGWVTPSQSYQYKYLQGNLDLMADLSALFCGFNPDRVFNGYLFAGVGFNHAFDNDEANALAGLNHPDGVLRPDDFVSIKANWEPKDRNLTDIAAELNLGADSFVFADDNPAERAIVAAQVPGVAVPALDGAENYIKMLDHGGYFEVTALSKEDLKKTELYHQNAQRAKAQASFSDYGEYLDSLEMTATIKDFEPLYIQRIAQLTNKSNQFNLTTLRCSEDDIRAMAENPAWLCRCGKLVDKFGDNGIVTVTAGEQEGETLHLRLWLMSCRVLKRGMEDAMMDIMVANAAAREVKTIRGYYYPTAKNAMVREFYASFGFEKVEETEDGSTTWQLDVAAYQPKHPHMKIER